MQKPPVAERALESRRHLHSAKLADGEIEVALRLRARLLPLPLGSGWGEGLFQQQLSDGPPRERDLATEAQFRGSVEGAAAELRSRWTIPWVWA